MSPACVLLLEGSAAPDKEQAYALGSVYLVGGQAQQVNAERTHIDFEKSCGLHGVCVNDYGLVASLCLCLYQACNFADGFNRADFVVRHYYTDQDGLVGDGVDDVGGVNDAILINGNIGYIEAELLKLVAGVQDSVVLYRGGDDVVAKVAKGEGYAL